VRTGIAAFAGILFLILLAGYIIFTKRPRQGHSVSNVPIHSTPPPTGITGGPSIDLNQQPGLGTSLPTTPTGWWQVKVVSSTSTSIFPASDSQLTDIIVAWQRKGYTVAVRVAYPPGSAEALKAIADNSVSEGGYGAYQSVS